MAKAINVQWLTFDVYSALFDFRTSLLPEIEAAVGARQAARAGSFLELWRTSQLSIAMQHAMLQRGHLSFRRATELALEYALARYAIDLPQSTRASLVRAWYALEPWPEAPETLECLHNRGYRLALLSNGDQAMLEALAERLPRIEAVLSAECASTYKPHPNIYRHALKVLAVDHDALLHVAGSSVDVMGARSIGLGCVWSNRFNDTVVDPHFKPTFEVADLAQLPGALDSVITCARGTP